MKIRPSPKRGRVVVELAPLEEHLLQEKPSASSPGSAEFRLRRILVPLDFSECSLKALDYAIPFARHFQGILILLHVVPVGYALGEFGALDFTLLEEEMRTSAENHLAALTRERIQSQVPCETLVRLGRPAFEIVEIARQNQIDLILLSTHGHTGLKHVFLGSVAENVVRYAPCPVLTVREHEHEFVTPRNPAPACPPTPPS